jgi:hypothetical protein
MGEAARADPLPLAAGNRLEWTDVPDRVRAAVEGHLGSPVLAAVNQRGGFSPGLAARVRCADGTRAFVKAVGSRLNPDSPRMYRSEAAVAAALPPEAPAPRLRFGYDDGDWVALVFDEVSGRPPAEPWRAGDLHRVMAALVDLAAALTPCPLTAVPALAAQLRDDLLAYSRLAADPPPHLSGWERAHLADLAALGQAGTALLAGDTLVHYDMRADNVLLGDGGQVWFVDWPWACRGPAWVDSALLVLNAATQGYDPEVLVAAHPLLSAARPDELTALVVALTGMFAERGWLPAPAGLPTLRAFQRAHHRVAVSWLRQRLGG